MKFKSKSLLIVAVILMLSVAAVGCNTNGQAPVTPPEDNVTDAEAQKPATKTVVDMAGRRVTLPQEINSIANFGAVGVLNAFVELMGEGSKISNEMSPRFTKTDRWKYQYVFAPQIKDMPVFQGANDEVLMEVVLKNKPDLCLTMDKTIVATLEAQGINVLYVAWDQFEDVYTAVNMLGEALNKQDVAKDYIEYFNKMVDKADELTKNIPQGERKKVLYGNVTQLTQPHVIAEWWIEKAGGISVTDDGRKDGSKKYELEDLLAWNPDVMILATSGTEEELKADKRINHLNAIKNGKIYPVPTVAHVWGNRTVEQPLTVMWAMHKIYPEIMPYDKLAEEIKYFYSHFYKYDLNEEQLAEIIGE